MCSHSGTWRRAVGREHSPEELQYWSCGCWMCIFPASLAAACLSGFWWSTDRRRWGQRELYQFILKGVWRDDGVKSGAVVYKEDPHISPWSVQMLQDEVQSHVDCIIHRPVCSVANCRGSSKRPVEAFI